jgi:hypothetical protein
MEACSRWYYEGAAVKGPVSTRTLARLLRREENNRDTQVFSEQGSGGEWKSLADLPQLKLAMEALAESEMPALWPANAAPAAADRTDDASRENDKNVLDEHDDDAAKRKQIAKEWHCQKWVMSGLVVPSCFCPGGGGSGGDRLGFEWGQSRRPIGGHDAGYGDIARR